MQLGPRCRVSQSLGRALLVVRVAGAERIKTFGWSPLTPTQLVVAGVHGNAQQPAAQANRRAMEGFQSAKGTEQRVLGRVRCVLWVAQRAVADVVDLALIDLDERVEGGDLSSLSRLERVLEPARLGLHRLHATQADRALRFVYVCASCAGCRRLFCWCRCCWG